MNCSTGFNSFMLDITPLESNQIWTSEDPQNMVASLSDREGLTIQTSKTFYENNFITNFELLKYEI